MGGYGIYCLCSVVGFDGWWFFFGGDIIVFGDVYGLRNVGEFIVIKICEVDNNNFFV